MGGDLGLYSARGAAFLVAGDLAAFLVGVLLGDLAAFLVGVLLLLLDDDGDLAGDFLGAAFFAGDRPRDVERLLVAGILALCKRE